MRHHSQAITTHHDSELLRNKAELALWLVGMVVASIYVFIQ